jgi:transcriptional antiterminator RfaH
MGAAEMDKLDAGYGWYLLFSKPRQETRAQMNLIQQGYSVFMPTLLAEKVVSGRRVDSQEPLFPRYLFIQLDDVQSNWLPVRSTLGVSQLVRFGDKYCRVPDALVHGLMGAEQQRRNLLTTGDAIRVTDGPFKGLEGIYQQADGCQRVLVLMQLFSKPHTVALPVASVQKAFA